MAKKEYKARAKHCTFAHIFIGKESVKNGELTMTMFIRTRHTGIRRCPPREIKLDRKKPPRIIKLQKISILIYI
jgi:hypothetical protein